MINLRNNLRNDKERKEFIENCHNGENGWNMWKSDEDLGRYWWRCKIADDVFVVVEEELRTFVFPIKHTEIRPMRYYITPEFFAMPFSEYIVSKTQVIDKLKELTRKGRT